jgi:hypothetical protein
MAGEAEISSILSANFHAADRELCSAPCSCDSGLGL